MKERFEEWDPKPESAARVDTCNEIIAEYQAQGLKLTLRQLYYQFVSRDLLDNTVRAYKNLGTLVSKARVAGMMDWEAIEDRGRRPDVPLEFDDLDHRMESAMWNYRLDRWEGQPTYCELWVEKAALAGVLEPLAREFHVTLMVNKGYSSQSAMYESAQRIQARSEGTYSDRPVHVLYLGDHDPSGQDMVRDIQTRLDKYTRDELDIDVETVALTTAQVHLHSPPPNPTKLTDSRAKGYIEEHGHECWEVDALDPATLQGLIRGRFEALVDRGVMADVVSREEEDKQRLREALEGLK